MPQRLEDLSASGLQLLYRLAGNEIRVDRISPEIASIMQILVAKGLISLQRNSDGHVTAALTDDGKRLHDDGILAGFINR